jgi:hypothetical protein
MNFERVFYQIWLWYAVAWSVIWAFLMVLSDPPLSMSLVVGFGLGPILITFVAYWVIVLAFRIAGKRNANPQ